MEFHGQYSAPARPNPWLQKKCSCGGTCSKCSHEHTKEHQGPGSVQNALQSPGQALDGNNRSFMESRFGQDFSGVKLHTDETASRSAQDMNAMAYTVGQDIVFDNKHYSPESPQGKHLIAHELTHTVQQKNTGSFVAEKLETGEEHDPLENEANDAADKIMSFGNPGAINSKAPKQILKAPPKKPPSQPAPVPDLGANFTPEQKTMLKAARDKLKPKEGGIVGVLKAEDGRIFEFESGGGQGFSSHIEGKATAKMVEERIEKATLLVEKEPCQICDRSVYDPEVGPEGPLKSTSTGKELVRQTPKINSALPRGYEITVVGPESTGLYRGTAPALPKVPKAVVPEGNTETKPKTAADPEAEGPKTGSKKITGSGRGNVKLPEVGGIAKVPRGGGGRGLGGKLAKGAAAGAANIALELAMLVTTLVIELIILPKLNELIKKLEDQHVKYLQKRIQKYFDTFIAKHIMKVLKICYLKQLKEMEAAGQQGFVNAELKITIEDKSNRFQLLEETPPESVFDIEINDVEYVDAELSETPVEASAGELTRCENCGAFSRGKSFIGNNPLWTQNLKFSFEAPTSAEIIAEFGDELDTDEQKCESEKGCFIATACYGSLYAPEVALLRQFRDEHLKINVAGRSFVRLYYFISPPIARYLAKHEGAKRVVRKILIAPVVNLISEKLKDKSVKV